MHLSERLIHSCCVKWATTFRLWQVSVIQVHKGHQKLVEWIKDNLNVANPPPPSLSSFLLAMLSFLNSVCSYWVTLSQPVNITIKQRREAWRFMLSRLRRGTQLWGRSLLVVLFIAVSMQKMVSWKHLLGLSLCGRFSGLIMPFFMFVSFIFSKFEILHKMLQQYWLKFQVVLASEISLLKKDSEF